MREMISSTATELMILDPSNLKRLKRENLEIEQEKANRQTQKDKLELRIGNLARRLKKSQEFVGRLERDDLSTEWLEALRQNLNKLEDEKKTKLKGIILNMREELRLLWSQVYYNEEQQEMFAAAFNEEFTEENEQAHEQEIARLTDYYEKVRL